MSKCYYCRRNICSEYCNLTVEQYIELIEHRDDLIFELEQNYLVEKEKSHMLLKELEEIKHKEFLLDNKDSICCENYGVKPCNCKL